MLQFDKRLTNETLADAKFLGQLCFDNLLSTSYGSGEDGLPQQCNNAGFLGDRFDAFKCLAHKYRECTLRICGLQRLIIGESSSGIQFFIRNIYHRLF